MKKKILIGVGVLLILIIGVIGYFVVSDLKQEEKLKNELDELNLLVNEENIDVDKVKEMLNRTVTTGDYKVVETSFKEYLSDAFDSVFQIVDILNDDKLVSILTVENYQSDGPNFIETKAYITETKTKLEELKNSYYSFLTEEKAMSYIENKGLDSYYVDLYKEEYVGDMKTANEDKTVEESINQIIELLNVSEEAINFLTENSSSWHIEEDLIVFDTDELSNEYLDLINKIQ